MERYWAGEACMIFERKSRRGTERLHNKYIIDYGPGITPLGLSEFELYHPLELEHHCFRDFDDQRVFLNLKYTIFDSLTR